MSNNGKTRTFAEAAPARASFRFRCAAAALTGVLFGVSFPPFSLAPAAWLAFVPLLLSWEVQESARASFIDAYAAFLIAFALAFQWPLFHTFSRTAFLSLPGLLVVPMWMAAPLGVACVFKRRLGLGCGLLALAAFYLLMEFGLRRGPLAFPWTLLGHSQAEWPPINRLAAFGGVPLLSGFVLTANVAVFAVVRAARRHAVSLIITIIIPIIAAGSVIHPGRTLAARGVSGASADQADSVAVGIVQPGISAERWAEVTDTTRVHELLRLSGQFHVRPELIVWPETALPPNEQAGKAARNAVSRWVDSTGIPLLAGAVESSDRPGLYYNAAVLFHPRTASTTYRKRRLVPFAERVPLQEKWPVVRRLAIPSGGVAGYLRGTGDRLMEISGARFGVQICFETLFDDAGREYARRDADFIVAITQDGWWGNTFGLRQHLAFNRLRALETGLPLVQVSVSGLSAVVAPDGAVRHRTGWMERSAFVAYVRTGGGSTPFVRLGDTVTPVAAVVAVLLIVLVAVRSLR